MEDMREMFGSLIIPGEAVYTLAECVASSHYDEDDAEYADADGDSEGEGASDPVSNIKRRFRRAVYLSDERKLSFLSLAAELSEKRAAWEEKVEYFPFGVFNRNGFVYLFENGGKYYLVLPDELAEIFREVVGGEGFDIVNAKNTELISYATGLIWLYGAYDMEQFANVWNQHHRDKITCDEAEIFHLDLNYLDSDYYFYDDYVVNECLDEEEFDELWCETEEIEYCMPTKSVIREYVAKRYDYDYKMPGQKEMDDFLAGYVKGDRILEELQLDIFIACERMREPEYVRELLEDAGAPLSDAAFVERFERLYNNLRGGVHIWELRGHTPGQYKLATGKAIPYFTLPKGKKRKK